MTLGFCFQGKTEVCHTFDSGLPQGSSLFPIFFSMYSASTISHPPSPTEINSIYVDEVIMLPGSINPTIATSHLQTKVNERTIRAIPLGFQYTQDKTELILRIDPASPLNQKPNQIQVSPATTTNKESIRLLGITINLKLTFQQPTATTIAKTQNPLPFLQ